MKLSFPNAVHGLLLIIVLPISVIYLPVYTMSNAGTLTLLDSILGLLWVTTMVRVARSRKLSHQQRLGAWLCLAAMLPALFAPFSAFSFRASSPLLAEGLTHIKRFGGPSIVTLALLMCGERLKRKVAKAAVVAALIMFILPLTPLSALLIKPMSLSADADSQYTSDNLFESVGRNSGTIFNPNDFGEIGVLVPFMAIAGINGRRAWLWRVVSIPTAAMIVFTSASRAAMVALICGTLYVLMRSQGSLVKRTLIAASIVIVILAGLLLFPSYKTRMQQAADHSSGDDNAAARVDAQIMAVSAWRHNPLGVGFLNFPAATAPYRDESMFGIVAAVDTSDSIYCDYLLGTGLPGLLAIILCFWLGLRIVREHAVCSGDVCLRAGILAAAIAAMAALSPASVFTAPFFFALIGICPGPTTSAVPQRAAVLWEVACDS
jgi:hypothetical protein